MMVHEEVSAILQQKLPPKLKDLESFTIPYVVENKNFDNYLLDLSPSINLIPYSIFVAFNLGELKRTMMSI